MTQGSGPPQDAAVQADPPTENASPRAVRFAQIVDEHQGPLLRYVQRMARLGTDQVEDVVQECFLRLHKTWGESDKPPMDRVGAWLFAVAHNVTMDMIRKQGRRLAAQESLAAQAQTKADGDIGVLGRLTQSQAADAAITAMDALPDDQKQVVLMKVLRKMTFRQIAQATGLSLGNVNYKLNQALGTLAKQLKQAGHI